MTRQRLMTEAMEANAREMRAKGLSYRAIGEAFGVSEAAIRYRLSPACKAQRADYRASHKEEKRAYNATYVARHREEKRTYNAIYVAAHKEEKKIYDAEHYAKNKERKMAARVRYRAENPERVREAMAAWGRKNRHVKDAHEGKRRALKAGALIGATASQLAEIAEVYRRAKEEPNIRCYLCGEKVPFGSRHVDHVHPLSKGGAHRSSNLAIACGTCNCRKHDKLPEELGLLL